MLNLSDLFGGPCAVCGKYTSNLTCMATSRVIFDGVDTGQFVNLCDDHKPTVTYENHNLIVNTLNIILRRAVA